MIEWGTNKNPKESKGFQKSLVKDEEEQKQEDQDLGQLWLTNQCQWSSSTWIWQKMENMRGDDFG